ncbi:OmpA family protein [Flavobacterium sp. Sd200]|uniref:OmpA family protein n=1 Tax=Flavobacterium sp. Sd200 TaxID=2692211 RepID=UPI00136F529F|nr:OmpA family protein [Flavobacterium sp. Sd200]MXN92461.1 OmpA family protein [Flavobacterium sp. Sd200]
MKKAVLPLLLLCLCSANLSAQKAKAAKKAKKQTTKEVTKAASDYDKWSIDFGGGFVKASNPMSPGYNTDATNLFNANLGARYMFNTKFGLKVEAYYDVLNNGDNSQEFESQVYGASLQGVVNLGRVLEFESWTKRIGLFGHAGVGISQLANDQIKDNDQLGNFLIGLGGQIRLSNSVALTADFTMINSFSQQRTWDGGDYLDTELRRKQGFDSTLYHATIGLSIYLGKHEEHADWYVYNADDKIDNLDSRIGDLETMMNDSDKDGVPDYLDTEPNTIAGVAVDSKGRNIDKNGNGVPDELESYIDTKEKEVKQTMSAEIGDLINGGYVNAYFDFGKDQPNAQSVGGINFLIKYLKENPSASADVVGYADEVGDTEYNKLLSARRAENVKKILIDAGIDGSRLTIKGNGEDSSVNKESAFARQTVRRVTFIIK